MDLPDFGAFRQQDWHAPVDGVLDLAVVGLGEFTRDWVIPSAVAAEHTAVGAVVSSSPERARDIGDTHDAVSMDYAEFEAGEYEETYDAVYVATPNATHQRYVESAAEQGKAVLCEKPLAATLGGARAIRDVCREQGVTLQVAYRLQTDPVIRWARAVIRAGAIGTPRHAVGTMAQDLFVEVSSDPDQWRLASALSGGAALIDLGIYPLNTTRFLTDNDPIAVSAATDRTDERFQDVDEHVSFIVEYEGGLQASFTASQQSARGDHLSVYGSDGHLSLEPAFFGEVTATLERDDEIVEQSIPDLNEMQEQLEYFASHVLRGIEPEPDGDHGVRDMAALSAGYESARRQERVSVSR